jgi:uncharacterized protein YutE (UPF0331/DUF86 family)
MTGGAIDLKVVGDRLQIVGEALSRLRSLPAEPEPFAADWRNAAAADAELRRGIEALFDVTRHLLSRRFGLGALESRQAARACAEKGLVRDPGLAARFVEIAGFRNRLTHFYDEVTADELLAVRASHLDDLEALAAALRAAASSSGTN